MSKNFPKTGKIRQILVKFLLKHLMYAEIRFCS